MDYCKQGIIYHPDIVAKQERYYLPYLHVADCATDIRLGMSLHSVLSSYRSLEEVENVIELFRDCNYMLSYCNLVELIEKHDIQDQGIYRSAINRTEKTKCTIAVSLKSSASAKDQLQAYLHALLLRHVSNGDYTTDLQLLKETKERSKLLLPFFVRDLEQNGWDCTHLFLEETKKRYVECY